MTPSQILAEEEKKFDELSDFRFRDERQREEIKYMLHSLTLKILKGESERLNGKKTGFICHTEGTRTDCADCEQTMAYNQAILEQISFLESQIKEIEGNTKK